MAAIATATAQGSDTWLHTWQKIHWVLLGNPLTNKTHPLISVSRASNNEKMW